MSTPLYLPKNPTHSKIPYLWLGTWSLDGYSWGKSDIKESEAIIKTALEQGITHIDTAGFSSSGTVEKIICPFLKRDRENFFISIKAGIVHEKDKKTENYRVDATTLKIALYQSLDRLKTSYLDIYLINYLFSICLDKIFYKHSPPKGQ